MRTIFIDSKQTGVATMDDAEDYAPWAAEIIEVDGGYMAFESATDADIWRYQV